MPTADTTLIDQAEAIVASRFVRLCEPTVKMASFRTAKGRQLGLAKERSTAIFLWVEGFNPSISGVEINNRKRPGLPYAPDQTRSSAVKTQCSQLKFGKRAFYLRCESTGALERFLDWYATC
jgi:hypothetical protein